MEVTKLSVGCNYCCTTVSASGGKDLEAGIGSHVVSESISICFNRLPISYSEVRLWRVLIGKDELMLALPAFGSANSLSAKVITAQALLAELMTEFKAGARYIG